MSEQALRPTHSIDNQPEENQNDHELEAAAAQAYREAEYFKWEDRCKQATLNERAKWTAKPGIYDANLLSHKQPWEADGLSDTERQHLYTQAGIDRMDNRQQGFSAAAHLVVHSPEAAHFLDDVKCDFLGDSRTLGWFKEISPDSNDSSFDVQFDYNVGRMNHYTENGMIVHVRETLDPAAKTRAQKLFIVTANLITRELQRHYAEDDVEVEKLYELPGQFNEVINLQPRALSSHNGQVELDQNNPLALRYQEEIDRLIKLRQPKLKHLASGGTQYKPEGYTEFGVLHPIRKLDEERHLLSMLARTAGRQLNERGAVEYVHPHLSIAN